MQNIFEIADFKKDIDAVFYGDMTKAKPDGQFFFGIKQKKDSGYEHCKHCELSIYAEYDVATSDGDCSVEFELGEVFEDKDNGITAYVTTMSMGSDMELSMYAKYMAVICEELNIWLFDNYGIKVNY